MMIVIADTSPIISLLKIDRLDLLSELFGLIFIPDAVYNELTQNEKYRIEAELIIHSDFIKNKKISNTQAVNILQNVMLLDNGESEAIILFDELKAQLLLIDERRGREIAEKLNIPISGTIGILIKAFEKNLLTRQEIFEYVDIFQQENRRFSRNLINLLKKRLGNE